MQEALKQERELLRPARDQADYIIDTSLLSAAQLKEQVAALFLKEKKEKMLITCTSFGFKYGIPSDADLVFDVRCLPNPFYIPELKYKTGLDQQVRDYVFSHEQAQQLYRKDRRPAKIHHSPLRKGGEAAAGGGIWLHRRQAQVGLFCVENSAGAQSPGGKCVCQPPGCAKSIKAAGGEEKACPLQIN